MKNSKVAEALAAVGEAYNDLQYRCDKLTHELGCAQLQASIWKTRALASGPYSSDDIELFEWEK